MSVWSFEHKSRQLKVPCLDSGANVAMDSSRRMHVSVTETCNLYISLCVYVFMYGYVVACVCVYIYIYIDGWTDGRTDGRTDGWMDGWMGGWIDGRT